MPSDTVANVDTLKPTSPPKLPTYRCAVCKRKKAGGRYGFSVASGEVYQVCPDDWPIFKSAIQNELKKEADYAN